MDTQKFNEDCLLGLENFESKLSIGKVVKYFEMRNIHFTKTTIQHYIKIKLLQEPKDKRYYTKEHLISLYFIYILKDVCSLEEIKVIFEKIVNEDLETLYYSYIKYRSECLKLTNDFIKNIEGLTNNKSIEKLILNTSIAYLKEYGK